MSANYGDTAFSYGGRKFSLFVTLLDDTNNVIKLLDNNDLIEFEYSNELDSLCLQGHIKYLDRYGDIDKLLDEQNVYVSVYLAEREQKGDGNIELEKESYTVFFKHTFVAENFIILDRNAEKITYQINLISSNIINCSRVIDFSNYNAEPQPIIDILKACITEAELEIEEKTFSASQTSVKLNYVTNGNDTLQTIKDFLMSRLFYYSKPQDEGLKFLYFNEYTEKYNILDLTQQDTYVNSASIVLSLFGTNIETYCTQGKSNLGSKYAFTNSNTNKALFSKKIVDYSMENNEFEFPIVKSNSIVSYLNGRSQELINGNKCADRFKNDQFFIEGDELSFNRASMWQDSYISSQYKKFVSALKGNNALIINTAADIQRYPGTFVTLAVDRDFKLVESENPADLDRVKTAYWLFDSAWFISKIRHIISPKDQIYKQNLTLMHNFKNIQEQKVKV